MASMTLVLPAPVGPVRANRSAPVEVDRPSRSRKAVNPSSSRRTGRIAGPRVAPSASARRAARRTGRRTRSSAASRSARYVGEQLVRASGRSRSGSATRSAPARAPSPGGQHDLDGVGEAARAPRRPARPRAGSSHDRAAGGRRRVVPASRRRAARRACPAACAGGGPRVSGTARTSAGVPGSARRRRSTDGVVGRLAEVELQRRAAVVQRGRAGEALGPVEVAEGDVVGGRREGGGRHPVVEDRVGAPLAAAQRAAQHHEVGGHEVDGVGAANAAVSSVAAMRRHPVGVGSAWRRRRRRP